MKSKEAKKSVKLGKLNINFTNKWFYSFIAMFVIILAGVVVFATAPNPGHSLDQIEEFPNIKNCGSGQVLKYDGSSFSCSADNYEANTDTQDLSISGNTLSLDNGGSITIPNANTECSGSDYLAGDGTCQTDSYESNTDNQDLSNVLSQGNDAGSSRITNLADPSNNQDAATKSYVDSNTCDSDNTVCLDVIVEDTYENNNCEWDSSNNVCNQPSSHSYPSCPSDASSMGTKIGDTDCSVYDDTSEGTCEGLHVTTYRACASASWN